MCVCFFCFHVCSIELFFYLANWIVEEGMEWTVQSIEQRSLLDMELAFGIPQSIVQVMISYA